MTSKPNLLKLIFWNMWDKNRNLKRAFDFIERTQADVIFLQEVPKRALPRLEHMKGYRSFKARDATSIMEEKYLVIFLKEQVELLDYGTFIHNTDVSTGLFGRSKQAVECIESQSILINYGGQKVRMINCHLSCSTTVKHRQSQLKEVLDAHDDGNPLIIGGDFNTLGRPSTNWLWGRFYGIDREEFWLHEVKLLHEFAEKVGLTVVFDKKRTVTHPISRAQLDHVLVSPTMEVVKAFVYSRGYGSDHRPLEVTLSF